MAESNYWTKFWRKKLSRRRLLSSAAVGSAGLAAAAVVGCQEEAGAPRTPAAGVTVTPAAATPVAGADNCVDDFDVVCKLFPSDFQPIDARREVIPAPADMRGGQLRYAGFDALVFDTMDPHQTQFGPLYSGHSAVFSKVLAYTSHIAQVSEPDLAEAQPETPDELTYIIKIRKDVFFHDNPDIQSRFPELAGRQLTAEDVKFSYERQMVGPGQPNEDTKRKATYYRASQYATIDKIDLEDQFTLKITLKEPISTFKHYLADTNAFVVAKELVKPESDTMETPDRMIGTGPFIWSELTALREFTAVRNPNWFGWGEKDLGRPYLDSYKALFVVLPEQAEPLFRQKELDSFNSTEAPERVFALKQERPELEFVQPGVSGWVNSRFKLADDAGGPCTPYADWRVRKAVHLAAPRRDVIDTIWRGSGLFQGPVGFVIGLWALPQEELATIPGYRTGAERDQDIAEARQLYEAAGSPALSLTFADQPSYIPRYAPTFIQSLRDALGPTAKVDQRPSTGVPYPQIAEGLLRGCEQMNFTWGFDNGWVDLDDWVYPYFHSRGSKNSFRVRDPELDSLLDAQRKEFDLETRRQLGFQIQRYILGMDPAGTGRPIDRPEGRGILARLDYAGLINPTVRWPYLKNGVSFPWFGNNYWIANVWLDRNQPSFSGRPS